MISNIIYIVLFLGIVPLTILIYRKEAFSLDQPAVPFLWLTAISAGYEYIGSLLLGLDTTYWFSVYNLLEFICLFYFFYKVLKDNHRAILYSFSILFGIAYIYSLIHLNDVLESVAINAIPTFLIVATCCGLWFKNLFEKTAISNLWQNAEFYFISGFVIYYSGTFLLFLMSDFIFKSNLYFYNYWFMNIAAGLILRVLLIIGTWKMKSR